MTGKPLRHVTHYLYLLSLMLIGVFALLFTGSNHKLRTFLVLLIALGYFIWGMVHHYLEKEIRPEIVLEYLLLALIGAGSVIGVLYYL